MEWDPERGFVGASGSGSLISPSIAAVCLPVPRVDSHCLPKRSSEEIVCEVAHRDGLKGQRARLHSSEYEGADSLP